MKNISQTLLLCLVLSSFVSAQEITKKQLDDVVIEGPKLNGEFTTREVSKVVGLYRNGELVLLKYDSVMTVNTPAGKNVAKSSYYFLVVQGKKVIRIEGTHLAPVFVASPWPIYMTHVNGAGESLGDVHYNIAIPEIGFFEYLEFVDGELRPLLEGESFDEFKSNLLEVARSHLSKSYN